MTNIPDDPVVRRVKEIVERHGELNHPETCSKVASGDRHRIDGLGPQLVGNLPKRINRQFPEVARYPDRVEKRGVRHHPISLN